MENLEVKKCRSCGASLLFVFVDLGTSPLANSYLSDDDLKKPEFFFPLKVFVCDECFLVQLPECKLPEEIFSHYSYFSSYSDSWLEHARKCVEAVKERFELDSSHRVVEIGSNDGYLLKNFLKLNIPVLGIEPARNVAAVAKEMGIETRVEFFSKFLAHELCQKNHMADFIIANNVLAHVPNLNDFIDGLKILLKPQGIVMIEVPHLLRLIEGNQLDTIYHEHYSYFSLLVLDRVFSKHGLKVFDVEELPTHGGSLRLFLTHSSNKSRPLKPSVELLLSQELEKGYRGHKIYEPFENQARMTKRKFLTFLIREKDRGKRFAAYGASAKGNTLLNYCGVGCDFIDFVVDRNPHKQGKFLPGSHIPIWDPKSVEKFKPDYLILLPWNLKKEIVLQMQNIRSWGGKFVVPIPTLEVIS